MKPVKLRDGERLDDLMRSGRRIIQNRQEFCFSLDAVLLAHFPRWKRRQRVLELGTGTGVIPLIIADEVGHVDAMELNPVTADLARRNVRLNGLQKKISIYEGDLRKIRELYPAERFDVVLSNPPYRPVRQGKASLRDGIACARHEFTATLEDVVSAARYALRFRGVFAMVHLPERLGEIMVALHEHRMEAKRLRMIQPREGRAPNMMLVEAVVGAVSGGLKVLPPLVVHEPDGGYTEEVLRIYECRE